MLRLPSVAATGQVRLLACARHTFPRPVGYLLALVDADHAGRSYATYGGLYIVAAVIWLWVAQGVRPDLWDVPGAAVRLIGAGIMLLGPRSALVRYLTSRGPGDPVHKH